MSRCDEHGMADEFVFVSVQYFIGAILSKKSCQKRGFLEKRWNGHMDSVSIKEEGEV